MTILAIDTALSAVSACVIAPDHKEPMSAETVALERGHAEALLPLIERVLAGADGGLSAVRRVAVTVGPGSFTGIRIGIAAARAFGLARGVPVVGVSTLAALAAPLMVESVPGTVVAAVDARHGQVYLAAFAPDGRVVLSPRISSVRDALRALGGDRLRLTGSGAPILALEAWPMGLQAQVVGSVVAPDIAYVARLGVLADPATSPARPVYLKAPSAKPQALGEFVGADARG